MHAVFFRGWFSATANQDTNTTGIYGKGIETATHNYPCINRSLWGGTAHATATRPRQTG